MKISKVICSAGVSGYFNKDLAAVRQGARQVGFGYIDPPVTPGFDAVIQPEELAALQAAAARTHMSEPLVDYVQALVRFTRESPNIETGLSPRGSLALVAAAKAHALVRGHSGVFPDDVQAIFTVVAGHRLKPASGSSYCSPSEICRHVLDSVAIS